MQSYCSVRLNSSIEKFLHTKAAAQSAAANAFKKSKFRVFRAKNALRVLCSFRHDSLRSFCSFFRFPSLIRQFPCRFGWAIMGNLFFH